MIAAPTLRDVLGRAEVYGRPHALGDRLVSIVFAQPASLVIRDLAANRMFWDNRTGASWDLFFAGYYAYGSHRDRRPVQLGPVRGQEGTWMFSPAVFSEFLRDVEHCRAGDGGHHDWRYSGGADVVSFMAYGGDPDWASLRAVELTGLGAPAEAPGLGRVVEGLRRWQWEEPDSDFAPGEFRLGPVVEAPALAEGLRWLALTVAAGVIGNRADEILDHLLSR